MRNIFYLIAISSVLIVAISLAYYLVVFLPNKENTKLELELQEKIRRETLLQECVQQAQQDYRTSWDKACINSGLAKECSLPIKVAEAIKEGLELEQNYCYKLYPTE
jgi:hypothetical protein